MLPLLACLVAGTANAGEPSQHLLDNGLRVVLIEHHANPMVATTVVVGAGAIHEPEGRGGASHFLEHLAFNGTESRTQKQLYDETDLFGAYNNATTRQDHTLYTLLIQREFADKGLDIQSDMLFHSTIPQAKFDKERGIMLEELAKDRNNPAYLADLQFTAFAWADTPLAHPVLGTTKSLESIERDVVYNYYKQYYTPGNMTLLVMGDFETAEMLNVIRSTFGDEEKAAPPPKSEAKWLKAPDNNYRQGPLEGSTHLFLGAPLELGPGDELLPAAQLLISAAASGADSPLARVLTSGSDPLVLDFSVGINTRVSPWTTLELSAKLPDGGDPEAVLTAVSTAIAKLGSGGSAHDRIPDLLAEAEAEETLLRDQIHYYGMSRATVLLQPGEIDLSSPEVDGELLDQAASLLWNSLSEARIGHFGPGLEAADRSWEPPAPPAQEATATLEETTLDSGMRIAFSRNDDSEVFALHLALHPRSSQEPEGKEGIAAVLHRMLMKGSQVRGEEALARAVRFIGAELKFYDIAFIPYDDYQTQPEFSYVRLQMPSAGWRQALDLLSEVLLHPALDGEDLQAVQKQILSLQKRQAGSASRTARRLLANQLAPDHPATARVLGTEESVSSIGIEDLRAFHESYVAGNHMLLTATGPMDRAAFEAAAAEAFADLPSGEAFDPTEPAVGPKKPTRVDHELGKDQSALALGAFLDVREMDRVALRVAVSLLSDHLAFTLREEQGLAYSVSARLGTFAGRDRLVLSMGTRPENIDTALSGLREQTEAFLKSRPDEEDVRRIANAARGRALMRRMSRVGQAYFAGMSLLAGESPDEGMARLDAMADVDAKAVQAAAKRYFDPDDLTVVVVK